MILPVYAADADRYEKGMEYSRCGRSGIVFPKIILGLWQNFGDTAPLSRSREMLHYAFDHGICSFDLANNYGPSYGSAEETFGRIMAKSFAPYRDELFITSKAGYDMWPGPYGNWGSRKYLFASLEQSLKRMNLDYVDAFYTHRLDPETPIEETLQALVDIVRQGKARYAGISNWPTEQYVAGSKYLAERDVPCLVYQGRLNILDRKPLETGLLEACEEHGSGFVAFSPLAQGLLTDKYLDGTIPSDSRAAEGRTIKNGTLTPEVLERLRKL
ncbi:MAG: aldo/keto reductase, partial [Muribaculaceae bacterium]|nr:aldo/keto reductase [Muribaculaceae bacterium]